MPSQEKLDFIRSCAREFDVHAVWLFGSSLGDEATAHDVDLAVEGIAPKRFYDFYARLFCSLPKLVDLVDLSEDLPINILVRRHAGRIYER